MKIAILSDIHGNALALKTVLEQARRCEVEHLFVLGDLVGYYYHPDKVVEQLEVWPKDMIQGNHEGMLKDALRGVNVAEGIRRKYGSGIDFALKRLSTDWIKKLTDLSFRKTVRMDGLQLELCHGSPWERDAYVYPDADKTILDKCVVHNADFVFMGHTHYPFAYCRGNTVIANVGSVGQARDNGCMATWAILDTSNRALIFKNSPYEVASVVEEVKAIDPHFPYLHKVLLRNAGGIKLFDS